MANKIDLVKLASDNFTKKIKRIVYERYVECTCTDCKIKGFDSDAFLHFEFHRYISDSSRALSQCPGCLEYVCKACAFFGNCDCADCNNRNDEYSYCKKCCIDENTTHKVYGTQNYGGKNPNGNKLIFYKTGEKRRW